VRRPLQGFDLGNQLERLGIVAGTLKPLAGQVEQLASVMRLLDYQRKPEAFLSDLAILPHGRHLYSYGIQSASIDRLLFGGHGLLEDLYLVARIVGHRTRYYNVAV
jgi:hypothetical protein